MRAEKYHPDTFRYFNEIICDWTVGIDSYIGAFGGIRALNKFVSDGHTTGIATTLCSALLKCFVAAYQMCYSII